jgi:hypothetical protein
MGGRLALDDALKQVRENNLDLEKAFEGWSQARIRAYQMIDQNPNSYYYRFNAPNEEQKKGQWTEEEKKLFYKRLEEVGANGQWGIFSMSIPGRVGYQVGQTPTRQYNLTLTFIHITVSLFPSAQTSIDSSWRQNRSLIPTTSWMKKARLIIYLTKRILTAKWKKLSALTVSMVGVVTHRHPSPHDHEPQEQSQPRQPMIRKSKSESVEETDGIVTMTIRMISKTTMTTLVHLL